MIYSTTLSSLDFLSFVCIKCEFVEGELYDPVKDRERVFVTCYIA